MVISQNTFKSLDRFLSRARPDSEKPLLTSKGKIYGSRSFSGRFLRFFGIAKPVELKQYNAFLSQKISNFDTVSTTGTTGKKHLDRRSFKQIKEQSVSPHNMDVKRRFQHAVDGLESGLRKLDGTMTMYYADGQADDAVKGRYTDEITATVSDLDKCFDQVLHSGEAVVGDVGEHLDISQDKLLKLNAARELVCRKLGPDSPVKPRAYISELVKKGFPLGAPDTCNSSNLATETDKLDDMYKKAATNYLKSMGEVKAKLKEAEAQEKARAEAQEKARAKPMPGVRRHRVILQRELKDALGELGLDPAKWQQLTMKDIKAAYKKASLKHHPDKLNARLPGNISDTERKQLNAQAENKFKAITNAHDLLSTRSDIFHEPG